MSITDLKNEVGESTLRMYFIWLATNGIYAIIWVFERYKIFNKMAGKEVVSRDLLLAMTVALGLSSLFTYFSAMSENLEDAYILLIISGLAWVVWYVITVIISFRFAKIMDEFYAKEFKLDLKFNFFYLLIFNFFYINYCVNELETIEIKHKFLRES